MDWQKGERSDNVEIDSGDMSQCDTFASVP